MTQLRITDLYVKNTEELRIAIIEAERLGGGVTIHLGPGVYDAHIPKNPEVTLIAELGES